MGPRRRLLTLSPLALATLLHAAPAHAAVKMVDGRGRVEVIPAAGGRGAGLLPGEALGPGMLAVGPKGHATLATDDGATLELEGPARLGVESAAETQVALASGHLLVSGGTHPLKVSAASGLVAVATGARFEVALADDGALRVAAQQGAVQLSQGAARATVAQGKELKLARGEALLGDAVAAVAPPVATPPAAPAPKGVAAVAALAPAPVRVPPAPKVETEPKLEVKWPKGPVAMAFTLRGQATPGAQVTANGVAAEVRRSGAFSVKLELPEGQSVISVSETVVGGKTIADQREVRAVAKAAEPAEAGKAQGSKPQVKQEAAGWE